VIKKARKQPDLMLNVLFYLLADKTSPRGYKPLKKCSKKNTWEEILAAGCLIGVVVVKLGNFRGFFGVK